jgi:hypothetical protein
MWDYVPLVTESIKQFNAIYSTAHRHFQHRGQSGAGCGSARSTHSSLPEPKVGQLPRACITGGPRITPVLGWVPLYEAYLAVRIMAQDGAEAKR